MVHGGAGHVQRERCWPNSPYAGDNATLAPLLLGVVPQAVRMASRSLTESGSRGPRTLRTSYRSYVLFHRCRRSCSPPQRSFLSCPTAVPGLEESRAVAPHNCRTHGTDWGSVACSRKKALSRSRACSQPAAQGREEESQIGGRREETGGGSWRREGGGAGDPTGVGGRCALRDKDLRRATFTRPRPQCLSLSRRCAAESGKKGVWGRRGSGKNTYGRESVRAES